MMLMDIKEFLLTELDEIFDEINLHIESLDICLIPPPQYVPSVTKLCNNLRVAEKRLMYILEDPTPEKLEEIVEVIRGILEDQEGFVDWLLFVKNFSSERKGEDVIFDYLARGVDFLIERFKLPDLWERIEKLTSAETSLLENSSDDQSLLGSLDALASRMEFLGDLGYYLLDIFSLVVLRRVLERGLARVFISHPSLEPGGERSSSKA